MPEYEIADKADQDLQQIAAYTVKVWGAAQAERYAEALYTHFEALARDERVTRCIFDHWPELRMSRCQHHYVFSLHEEGAVPAIVAVLHEKMDLVTRLRERLGDAQ